MAQIKRIFYNNKLVYPLTITDAVLDSTTGKQLSIIIKELKKPNFEVIPDNIINRMIKE